MSKSASEMIMNSEYTAPITWIINAREKNKSWNYIKYAGKENEEGLKLFLIQKIEDFWTINIEEWYNLVEYKKQIEENSTNGFIGDPKKPKIVIPTDGNSCWINYKKKLITKKFTYFSITNIENSTQKIVSQIENATAKDNPVRGMVVGNVQSGKTASMSGVISMASDYGFNFFIILTGTIDNLRTQTRKRIISDLMSRNCNLQFVNLDNLSSKTTYPNRISDLYLNNSNRRYITVCLKNSSRLKDLLNWMNKDLNAKNNLKIIMIDDEVDQASVNTKSIEREEQTSIPRLIKNIVFARNSKDENSGPYKCMNYIGYTATPYANFLNESGNNTLYPKNFISSLNTPPEYFGPQQIFGIDGINDPMNIINPIIKSEIDYINNDERMLTGRLPQSLVDSLIWFVITIAIFRYQKIENPVSMLIHTSQKVERHSGISSALTNFFKNKKYNDLSNKIREIYLKETKMISIDDFRTNFKDYNNMENIYDYPKFEDIEEEIIKIFNSGITHIKLDDNDSLRYNEGIHLCIDNCKPSLDWSIQMRIIYPDKDNPINKISPAFIVIGGTTLSRGLTLEGLTTSYFLRNTNQADTLMQMGRWFGYRPKYELLPRLWLSKESLSRYNRLTRLDYDLRNELNLMELKGLSPREYGPRLDNFPDYKLLVLTAKNKQQSSIECQTTFYNKDAQTTWFYKKEEYIDNNYKHTINFLNSLDNIDKEKIKDLNNPFVTDNTVMWFDVEYNKVIDYLKQLSIPSQAATFIDIEKFRIWFKSEFDKKSIMNWTIIVGQVEDKINNTVYLNNGLLINLENRTRIERELSTKDYNQYIDLNTISQSKDRLMDIRCDNEDVINEINGTTVKFIDKRIKYASKKNPLLIIYIIDKESGKGKVYSDRNGYKRYSLESLHLSNHLVGYYIYIPYGEAKENEGYVTIKLDYQDNEVEVDNDVED